jgi:DNA helicase-2/ATP-dependent DNA helicase PcrA
MTLHSAKGLEYPVVFMVGVEEELFPHYLSIHEPTRLEEERRLAYVGITRAQRQLYLSYAERRRLHGNDVYPRPSRFLIEISAELIRDVRARTFISRPMVVESSDRSAGEDLGPGRRVNHRKFGEGVILEREGQGAHARVQVRFAQAGVKWLVLAYAGLELV